MSSTAVNTPAELARDAFKQLAARRIPPTPENYARMYAERAGKQLAEVQPAIAVLEAVLEELHADPARAALAHDAETALERGEWKALRQSLKTALAKPPPKPVDPQPDWPELLRELIAGLRMEAGAATTAAARCAEVDQLMTAGHSRELFARVRNAVRGWKEQGAGARAGIAESAALENARTAGEAGRPSSDSLRHPGSDSLRHPGSDSLRHPGSDSLRALGTDSPRPQGSGPARSADDGSAAPAGHDEFTETLKNLIAKVIVFCVDADVGYSEKAVAEAADLARSVQQAVSREEVAAAASRLRQYWIGLELRREGPQFLIRSLQALLQLLMQNLGDLVADDRWVRGQVERIQALLAEPLTPAIIEQAESSFKDYLLRQGTLKQSLDEARSALRDMMAALLARMGTVTASTGQYADKLAQYSQRIRGARDIPEISDALGSLLTETQSMHGDMARTHGELKEAEDRVQVHEKRLRELESQLADLSQRVGEDPLTQALNRRGLDQQYTIEEARTVRKNVPLCLAVLDVDNFKQINDRLGHAAGDEALRHLVAVVRQVIRPTDSLARYGGEEFVILLPETTMENAERVMIRMQRELTKRFFLHNNERVLITFSAGIAERREGETQQQLIDRADAAMYRAKRAGKNRVQRAD